MSNKRNHQKVTLFTISVFCFPLKLTIKYAECTLLHGFRKGQMEKQLELADIDDLVHMLPIVYVLYIFISVCYTTNKKQKTNKLFLYRTSCITLLPFGMTDRRRKLKRILESKIASNEYLKMHFYFFYYHF